MIKKGKQFEWLGYEWHAKFSFVIFLTRVSKLLAVSLHLVPLEPTGSGVIGLTRYMGQLESLLELDIA